MKEYVPIILIAALIMGMAGTLLAKSARKKSSYPLLITSSVMAIITFAGIIFAVVALFLPAKIVVENTVPAIIYDSKTGDLMKTSVTFDGEWNYSNIFKRNKGYTGKISVDCLEYTKTDCEIELSYFNKESETLNGIYGYSDSAECILFTDEKGTWFYIDTGDGFITMAPAETAGEAKEISSYINKNME